MRRAYVHDAVLVMQPDGDPQAPGGAITAMLCGSWDHPPPCPLAPHHVASSSAGAVLTLRVLFAAEPADEPRVRALIDQALLAEELTGPDGRTTTWQLRSTAPSRIRPDEEAHAGELVNARGVIEGFAP